MLQFCISTGPLDTREIEFLRSRPNVRFSNAPWREGSGCRLAGVSKAMVLRGSQNGGFNGSLQRRRRSGDGAPCNPQQAPHTEYNAFVSQAESAARASDNAKLCGNAGGPHAQHHFLRRRLPRLPEPSRARNAARAFVVTLSRPNTSQSEFVEDRDACLAAANNERWPGAGPAGGNTGAWARRHLQAFGQCMGAKGYKDDPNGFRAIRYSQRDYNTSIFVEVL